MENDSNLTRTCSGCIHWQKYVGNESIGACRANPPHPGEIDNWPQTRAESSCGRWKGVMSFPRQSRVSDESIISEIRSNLVEGQEYAPRTEVINQTFFDYGLSKPAVASRLNTMVKFGLIGIGKRPPGSTEDTPEDMVWILDENAAKHNAATVNPGRPRAIDLDTFVAILARVSSPSRPIGIRPLHREIAKSFPVALGTVQNNLQLALEAGRVRKIGTGWCAAEAAPQKTEEIDVTD